MEQLQVLHGVTEFRNVGPPLERVKRAYPYGLAKFWSFEGLLLGLGCGIVEALHMLALQRRCPGACHAFRERGEAEGRAWPMAG